MALGRVHEHFFHFYLKILKNNRFKRQKEIRFFVIPDPWSSWAKNESLSSKNDFVNLSSMSMNKKETHLYFFVISH